MGDLLLNRLDGVGSRAGRGGVVGSRHAVAIIATASGIAIYGFEGFALGLAGLMTPIGWCVATAVNGVLAAWLCPASKRARWWQARLAVARNAIVGPGIVAYLVMLVLCAPAALPDFSDDGVRYHLAYAYEWYRAGHIFADTHFRFPFYTFNTEALYARLFVRASENIPFINWMAGTVAVLTIYGLVAAIDEKRQSARSALGQGAAKQPSTRSRP